MPPDKELAPSLDGARSIGRFLWRKINGFGGDQTGRKDWTDAVQDAFHEFLQEGAFSNNSEILPPRTKQNPHSRKDAFLLDFVLWRRDLGSGSMEGAWIGCESEWDRNLESILKDFDKLLSFRAPYKTMIYSSVVGKTLGEDCRKEFLNRFRKFNWHLEDETYIFLEFVNDQRLADIYVCQPSRNLELEPVAPEGPLN